MIKVHHTEREFIDPSTVAVEAPEHFEGPRHRASVLNLARAAFDLTNKDKLIESGYVDEKTGLKNNKAFESEFDKLLEEVNPGDVSLLFFDLDKLKSVNDTISWDVGDRYKITTGRTIASEFGARDTDNIYLIGGDEFVVLLDNRFKESDEPIDYEGITDRVQKRVTEDVYGIQELENSVGLGVSAGWSVFKKDDTRSSMIERAHDMVLQQKDERYQATGEQNTRLQDPRL